MIYQPKVTTEPSEEPITLAEAKLHLRVDATADNDLITSMVKAARQWCESYQNRSYITQTITLKMDAFPCDGDYLEIIVPRPRLVSVTSVKYYDTDGVQQTLSDSVYDVDVFSEPGRIGLAHAQSWPGVRGDLNGIEIIYVAGYGAAADVPDRIKHAIKLIVGHLYEHREQDYEATLTEIPFSAKSLLSVDRVQIV